MTDDLRILIIEDDPDVALGCEQALQLEGFAAECAGSAELGRKRLGAEFPGHRGQRHPPARPGRPEPAARLHGPRPGAAGGADYRPRRCLDGCAGDEGWRHDFLQKPFAPEHLVDIARRALENAGWCWKCAPCAASSTSATGSKPG